VGEFLPRIVELGDLLLLVRVGCFLRKVDVERLVVAILEIRGRAAEGREARRPCRNDDDRSAAAVVSPAFHIRPIYPVV
jgi:hypothetical protein